jgi:hypothetical protein
MIVPFPGAIDGIALPREGHCVELPDHKADELVEKKIAEAVEDEPKPKAEKSSAVKPARNRRGAAKKVAASKPPAKTAEPEPNAHNAYATVEESTETPTEPVAESTETGTDSADVSPEGDAS